MDDLRREWSIYRIRHFLKKNLHFLINTLKKVFAIRNYLISINELKKNSIYREKHKEEVCFIIGNGISITELEIETINRYYVFACNEIFYHKDFHKLRIDYYTVAEPYFGQIFGSNYKTQTLNLYNEIDAHFKNKSTQLFFHITLKKLFKRNGVFIKKDLSYFNGRVFSSRKKSYIELDKGINFNQGALSFMISTAKYMGFKKVILLGCGFTFSPRMEFHFYARPVFQKSENFNEQISEFAKKNNLSIKAIDENDNEITPIFTSPQKHDETYKLYELLNSLSEIDKFEIINVHPLGFSSPIFNGFLWDDVKNKIL